MADDDPPLADRVRYLLSTRFQLALAVCLLVALLGGFVAYQAHTAPDTTTESRIAGNWTTNATFEHFAVVTNGSIAFEAGETLHNRPVYFRQATPVLNGTYVVEHEGDATGATFDTTLRLVVRATERSASGDDSGTVVLWRVVEPLATVESRSLAPGETRRIPFSVNVTARMELVERIQEELGSTRGQAEVLVVAETNETATVAGEERSGARTDRMRVMPRSATYSVQRSLTGARTRTVRETVTVPVETSPLREWGSIVAFLAGLLAAGGLVALDRNDRLDLPPGEAAAIGHRRTRHSFREWISVGTIPPPADGERVVAVDSLTDLVDVAIDSDRRVIEDEESGEFAVLDGSTRYAYRPDGDGVLAPTDVPRTDGTDPDVDDRSTGDDGREPDDAAK